MSGTSSGLGAGVGPAFGGRGFASSAAGGAKGKDKSAKGKSGGAAKEEKGGEGEAQAKKQGAGSLSLEDLLDQVDGNQTRGKGALAARVPRLDLSALFPREKEGKVAGAHATLLPEGLPKGLRLELTTGSEILLRPEMLAFLKDVLAEAEAEAEGAAEAAKKHLVEGPRGTGKSTLLCLLVLLARMKGWVVLYLPSAAKLLRGGRYSWDEESGLWDNPEVADAVLSDLKAAHGDQLAALGLLDAAEGDKDEKKKKQKKGAAIAAETEAETEAEARNSAQVLNDLLTGLASQRERRVLVCVDDYNALFGEASYLGPDDRPVSPHDLRLVCAFRLLERPDLAKGAVVAAPTTSLPLRKTIHIRESGRVNHAGLSPFSYEEACASWSKSGQEQPSQRSREEQILRNFVLGVNGNGHAIRDYSALL